MTCRVPAPLNAPTRREAASRPLIRRFVRIARHRALRWFSDPIAVTERERRDHELAPSLWQYDFRSWR
jgi:hypothetical protein